MNGQREIDEANRDWQEARRYPRGNRLTIQPINAPSIRYEARTIDPPRAPVRPPPSVLTEKDRAEMNAPPYERGNWYANNH